MHIAYIGGPPMVWVADPKNELRSVKDVVAAAKADKLSGYATSGVGTLGHLVVEYVARREGLKLNHIPYNTAAFADTSPGRVPSACSPGAPHSVRSRAARCAGSR